jgi:hypothetical protein
MHTCPYFALEVERRSALDLIAVVLNLDQILLDACA